MENLNEEQLNAVKHIDGPMLILAGAGSGKTKTLTSRLAYLIGEIGIDPANTLTLTFTNKAAGEMRERALKLLNNKEIYPPLLCTFHKFGLLFLKFHIEKIGRKNNFVIIDTDDKKRIIRNIAKELKFDISASMAASEISKYKNSLLSPSVIIDKAQIPEYQKIAQIYQEYQKNIEDNNLVDFDDLLKLTYEILNQEDELRKEISKKYTYIMVDEYQDTNELQFKLLELLASEHNNLCVVGDDDQSIYGWRGANIRNILEFASIFSNTKTVKLETNYRSKKEILDAANLLIEHNSSRLGKKLISHKGEGGSIKIIHSIDESNESKSIATEIKSLIEKGVNAKDIAVLYRINALSRSLEEGFTKEKLSYKLIGGIRFYERSEIKDIISYLRILTNLNDDFSLIRIINKPKRGVGKTSIDKLQNLSFEHNCSIFSLYKNHKDLILKELGKKATLAINDLFEILINLQDEIKDGKLLGLLDMLENKIKLKAYYQSLPDGYERVLNIEEFYGFFQESILLNPDLQLEELLNDISLQSDQDNITNDAISIMSIHASKGLEFEYVYVIGLEEEFFPLLGDDCNIEEERRLGYVAITRAKSHITLCYSDSRFYKGKRKIMQKSRFLGEAGLIQNSSLKITKSAVFKKGDLVKHKIFGIGRIQNISPSGKEYKLLINFGGNKKEILSSFVQSV